MKKRIEEEILLNKENTYSKMLIDSKLGIGNHIFVALCIFQEPFKDIWSLADVYGVK